MSRVSFLLVFLALAAACGPEKTPISVSGNNDDNNSAECNFDGDCDDLYRCTDGVCVPGACLDGVQSPGEADVDCGRDCGGCALGSSCLFAADCASAYCDGNVCADPGATNGMTNNANNTNNAPACEDPGTPERFVSWDNGIAADIGYEQVNAGPVTTGGIAIADFDGDDDVDVLVTNNGGSPALFLNGGGGDFTTSTAGLEGLVRSSSVSVADFDGDGDTDAILGRTDGGVYVLINQGDGSFVDETATRGIGDPADIVSAGSFADFDGDGDLDFYLANYEPPLQQGDTFMLPEPLPNRLYRNDGTGVFSEISNSPGGPADAGSTLGVAWWDFDGDGNLDLWLSNDFGMLKTPNQLWRNVGPDPGDPDGWLFEEVSAAHGLDVAVFAMSASLADIDNDGDQDGYVSNMGNNVLHVRNGDSTVDEAAARGVACSVLVDPRPAPLEPPSYTPLLPGLQPFFDAYLDVTSPHYTLTSWAATFFDANNDGWQDLHVVNGSTLSDFTPESNYQPNYLFVNKGDGTFEQAPCWVMPDVRGTSRAAAAGDLDGDGDMDLIWSDQGDNGEPGVYVLKNELATGNFLTIKLTGRAPNLDAIGAKVTVQAGGITQTRWIDGGQSFLSVSERVAHFGLGAAQVVDSVEVVWPDGTTEQVPVDAVNRRWNVQQP